MKEKKIAIVNEMVKEGYKLCGRTVEELASIFSLADLEAFLESYKRSKEG